MTYESLTETQNTSSIPKFLKASNFSSNAGNCCDEQVGVKAPGNENIKTLFSENVFNFVDNLIDKENKKININLEDEIIEKTQIK